MLETLRTVEALSVVVFVVCKLEVLLTVKLPIIALLLTVSPFPSTMNLVSPPANTLTPVIGSMNIPVPVRRPGVVAIVTKPTAWTVVVSPPSTTTAPTAEIVAAPPAVHSSDVPEVMVVTPTGLSKLRVVAALRVIVVPLRIDATPPLTVTPAPPIVTAPVASILAVVPAVRKTAAADERVAEVAPDRVRIPAQVAVMVGEVSVRIVAAVAVMVGAVSKTVAGDVTEAEVVPERAEVVAEFSRTAVVALSVKAAVLIVITPPALMVVPRVVLWVYTLYVAIPVPRKVELNVVPLMFEITPDSVRVAPPVIVVEVTEVNERVTLLAVKFAELIVVLAVMA